MIAALFVAKGGCYFGLPNVDPWDESRDARLYAGPWPVVAHPPCQKWINLGRLNYSRWGGEHNRPGNDGGCFVSALASVRRWGGVLEHPADSDAFPAHGIPKPATGGWVEAISGEWITEVRQSAYGHRAMKRTWLLFHGPSAPPALDWSLTRGTHQIGNFDQKLPRLPKRERAATPIEFRDVLIAMAETAVGACWG